MCVNTRPVVYGKQNNIAGFGQFYACSVIADTNTVVTLPSLHCCDIGNIVNRISFTQFLDGLTRAFKYRNVFDLCKVCFEIGSRNGIHLPEIKRSNVSSSSSLLMNTAFWLTSFILAPIKKFSIMTG